MGRERSTSPRFSNNPETEQIQQVADMNKRLMCQIDATQAKHNMDLQQAIRILDNTNKQPGLVKTEMAQMQERHQGEIERVR